MILFKQIELLQRAHKLISQSLTGTPEVFSRRLGISERRLYEIIDEMKAMGAPIEYSRIRKNYYYQKICEARLECTFRCLSDEEVQNISAGNIFMSKIFFTACFMRRINVNLYRQTNFF
jgi:predicted DNA-binding transcriptional regulator YafY